MKYYTTSDWYELLREAEEAYTPKEDHLEAKKRENAPVAKKPNKIKKPSAGFSDTPREGEARSVETGVTLPKKNEAKSAKEHGKDVEEREFDRGVYGFQSDRTGTIKGHDAQKLRSGRLSRTRMHRWAKAIKKLTGSDNIKDNDGGHANSGDEAMEARITQERLKFLERRKKGK